MPKRGRHEPLAVLAPLSAFAAANHARLPLQICERRLPRSLVRLADLTAHQLVIGQRVQHAHALRTREHEVVTRDWCEPLRLLVPLARLEVERPHGDRPLPHRLAQRLPARRVDPAKQRPQLTVVDDARQLEPRSTLSRPDPRRLATTRVVVVQTAHDLLLVVGLLPQRQLRHAQHSAHTPNPTGAETHMHPKVREKEPFTAGATPADHLLTTREPAKSGSGPKSALCGPSRSACKQADSGPERHSVQPRRGWFDPRCAHPNRVRMEIRSATVRQVVFRGAEWQTLGTERM